MGLPDFLEELPADEAAPLSYAALTELSGISFDDARELAKTWAGWTDARLVEFLTKLTGLAEEDALLEFEAVFKEALDAPQPNVRSLAVAGLSDCMDHSLVARFAALLSDDPSEEVRTAVALGMARFATMAIEGKLTPRDRQRVREALEAVLENRAESLAVRRRALEAIGTFAEDAVATRIRAAFESSDTSLTQSAIYAMGRSCDPRWLPEVITELDNPDPAIRYEATLALGAIGEEIHVDHLGEVLEDDDALVGVAAAESLAKIGGATAKRLLSRATQSARRVVAEAAENALQDLGREDATFEDQLDMRLSLAGDVASAATGGESQHREHADDTLEELYGEFGVPDDFGSDRARWN